MIIPNDADASAEHLRVWTRLAGDLTPNDGDENAENFRGWTWWAGDLTRLRKVGPTGYLEGTEGQIREGTGQSERARDAIFGCPLFVQTVEVLIEKEIGTIFGVVYLLTE